MKNLVGLASDLFHIKEVNVRDVLGSDLLILILEGQCDASERDPKPTSDWFFTDDPLGPVSDNCSQSASGT